MGNAMGFGYLGDIGGVQFTSPEISDSGTATYWRASQQEAGLKSPPPKNCLPPGENFNTR